MSLCIPYASLEPIRDKLQAGYQSEQLGVEKTWSNRFKSGLLASKVDITANLGKMQINAGEVINLKRGDVIPLDRYATDPLDIFVEGILKYRGNPVTYKGSQAIQIKQVITSEEVIDYGTE
jgi:flagellar motor switch protein FliM